MLIVLFAIDPVFPTKKQPVHNRGSICRNVS